MQDNGSDRGPNICSGTFIELLAEPAFKHRRTQPYRRQALCNAEWFNRTLAGEFLYAQVFKTESDRRVCLARWVHDYNRHRHRTAAAGPPASRARGLARTHNYCHVTMQGSDLARSNLLAIRRYLMGSTRRVLDSAAIAKPAVDAATGSAVDDSTGEPSRLDLPYGVELARKPMSRELEFYVTDPPWAVYPSGLVVKTLMHALGDAANEFGMFIVGRSPAVASPWDGAVRVCHTSHGKARLLRPGETPLVFSGMPGRIDVDLTWPDRSEIVTAVIAGFIELRDDPVQPTRLYGFNAPNEQLAARWTKDEYLQRGMHADNLQEQLTQAAAEIDDTGPVVKWFTRLTVRLSDVAYEAGCPYVLHGIATHISGLQGNCYPHRQHTTAAGYAPLSIGGLCGYYSPVETAHYVVDLVLTWYGHDPASPDAQRIAERIHERIAERFTPEFDPNA